MARIGLQLVYICSVTLLFTVLDVRAQQDASEANPPDSLPSTKPVITASNSPGYQLVINPDSTFEFHIPQKWDAIDNGASTEGFFILPPENSNNVIISIFKSNMVGTPQGFIEMLKGRYGAQNVRSFIAMDNNKGYHISTEEESVFVKLERNMRMMLQVEASGKWRDKFDEELKHIARSMDLR